MTNLEKVNAALKTLKSRKGMNRLAGVAELQSRIDQVNETLKAMKRERRRGCRFIVQMRRRAAAEVR